MKLVLCLLSASSMAVVACGDDLEFRPLFDGHSLDGWTATPGGKWEVKEGVIVGKSDRAEAKHGILLSDRSFSDFVIKARFRVLAGNSGFYFRAEPMAVGTGVHGIQVEVDKTTETGGLYETGGRGWVVHAGSPNRPSPYHPGEWTDLELTAVRGDVVVKINGEVASELTADTGRREGRLGLQLHGGQEMHVEFKDIVICEIQDAPAFEEMFNGTDLTGWKTSGNWVVESGNVITLKPRPGESGWQRYQDYLTTDRKYGDFVLDLEFKFNQAGNSGVFMRVGDLKDHVKGGFEVQILDTHGKKKYGAHDCGGVIGTSAPAAMAVKPFGQWNRYTITLKGSQLKVVLNGQEIQQLDLSQTGLKDRPSEGYISFQDEAKRIWYRNVRIKELK